MIGVSLAILSAFLVEISTSIGKFEMEKREESPYTMVSLNFIFGIAVLAIIAFVKPASFVFSLQSLPTFSLRVLFEILQVYFTMKSIILSDRSSASFILVLTIPFLLLVDIFLGYALTTSQFVGVSVIVLSLLLVFLGKDFNKKGMYYTFCSALNAVITISLFKYNITHFNSVIGEQLVISIVLLVFFSLVSVWFAKENPFTFLRRKIFVAQSGTHAIAGVVESFSYIFAPASVIVAAKRSACIFWAVLSGNHYFHEKHFLLKIFIFLVLAIGIVFLAF
jgi:hypothetical protein